MYDSIKTQRTRGTCLFFLVALGVERIISSIYCNVFTFRLKKIL